MTAKLQAQPSALLDEDFTPDELHPADLEQVIVAAYDEYENVNYHLRKRYRDKYNSLVSLLADKRGFFQFSFLR